MKELSSSVKIWFFLLSIFARVCVCVCECEEDGIMVEKKCRTDDERVLEQTADLAANKITNYNAKKKNGKKIRSFCCRPPFVIKYLYLSAREPKSNCPAIVFCYWIHRKFSPCVCGMPFIHGYMCTIFFNFANVYIVCAAADAMIYLIWQGVMKIFLFPSRFVSAKWRRKTPRKSAKMLWWHGAVVC